MFHTVMHKDHCKSNTRCAMLHINSKPRFFSEIRCRPIESVFRPVISIDWFQYTVKKLKTRTNSQKYLICKHNPIKSFVLRDSF